MMESGKKDKPVVMEHYIPQMEKSFMLEIGEVISSRVKVFSKIQNRKIYLENLTIETSTNLKNLDHVMKVVSLIVSKIEMEHYI